MSLSKLSSVSDDVYHLDLDKRDCDPCKRDGINKKASYFCFDCTEYLCSSCYQFHKKLKVVQHHIFQDLQKMPRDSAKLKDIYVDKCPSHSDKTIDYFCDSCDQLCCYICYRTSHCSCPKVANIQSQVYGLGDSEEFKELDGVLTEMDAELTKTRAKYIKNSQKRNALKTRALAKIKKEREEVKRMFDTLETEMKFTLDQKDRLDNSKLELVNKQCDILASDIRTLRSHLSNAKPNEKFVVMKKAKNYVPVIKDGLTKVNGDNEIQEYEFEISKELADMKRNVITMGLLLLQSSKTKRSTEFRASINIKGSMERQCDAYGLCLVNETKLVVCDHYNMSLKVVDTKQNCVLSVFALPAQPNDVTTVKDEQVAATLQTDKKIKILSVSRAGTLTNESEISVDGNVQGIAYADGNLYVTYDKPDSKVQIMDLNGRVYRSFKANANGGALFYRPWNIALSPDQSHMYVSDYGNGTVTCMALDGKVVACYWDKELKGPKGLAVDKEGSVYVCGSDSNNIHQLTSNCQKIQILLHRFHGIQGNTCIAYCSKTNRLYVEWYNRNEIKVYELK